ncbi:MAG: tetratricopeptide repeat protein [Deltaproteobacteria bacterium]|nr:tetratricopeptide repeat protein [Deltaproteobacteria bacterium]
MGRVPGTREAVIAALLLIPSLALADGEGDAWTAAIRGTGLAIRGDLRAAADAYRPVAAHLRPGPGQHALGLLALAAGDLDAAARAFRRSQDAGEAAADLFYWQGVAELARGRTRDALVQMERAVTLAPDRPEPVLALAVLRRDPDLLVRAARAEPDLLSTTWYPEPRRGLVRICARLLRDLPAREQVRGTIALLLYDAHLPREAEESIGTPSTDRERALLGRIALDRGELPRAQELLTAATRSDSTRDSRALFDLARAQVASGRRAEAAVTLRRAIDAEPGVPAVLVAAAELAREQGDTARAGELARYALERSRDFAPAHRIHAQVLLARGAVADAFAEMRAAALLGPADPAVWSALARIAQRQGARPARVRAFEARAVQAERLAADLAAGAGRARAAGGALHDVRRAILASSPDVPALLEAARRAGAPARAIDFARVAWLARTGREADARRIAERIVSAAIPLARWSRMPAATNLVSVSGQIDGRRVTLTTFLDDLR